MRRNLCDGEGYVIYMKMLQVMKMLVLNISFKMKVIRQIGYEVGWII